MHFARKRDAAVFWFGLTAAIVLGFSKLPVMAVGILLMVYLLLDRSETHRDERRRQRQLSGR